MDIDNKQLGELMTQAVPWVRTAGIEFLATEPGKVVVGLPDHEDTRNHVGGPHAAMMFGAGETASGAVVMASFAEQLDRATPLVARAEIHYRKLALGPLRAEAVLGRTVEEIVAELDAGERPEFPVHVTITNGEGVTTGELTVVWTLKPRR
ncbi:Acyl-coenzyme A thioesterase PaaI, contains HGG motif [Streptoalloteichus tenebrarius]|uniref:Acyl-coenzyme A thioesterase PaaI, contains HGG motif n=1 Tax=Streptoalloteichus tenebrarius (strain ATCC 17920 / DSM 40477 / JCM 4838 / CBS 697.72 / NBRC 16177 / NCIMB 11028 / NRRL B-12390 / A12253. 1 / ISP 5477) TaxID=1933 RepID=A0ABT1HR06_STRSD|nr:DUF4442 domain-containing protein [Streptoalloteichus tenebrarius]MCP2257938.1 Acyl-coenzyme A thioesterase PaaI, contains HGG motif [Streptoalloteichus tenebrarius]BFF01601.1 DUF4442 domain-containing protein [Streptoalloteichus tenebrarius]